jgi:hypothetical protein
LLLAAEGGDPVVLSATGEVAWRALDSPLAAGDLAGLLADAFGADPDVVGRDVAAMLGDLAARGLAEVS